MVSVSWPSDEAPGFPAFNIDLPSSWEVQSQPGAAFFAHQRDAGDGFVPNVLGNVRRIRSDMSIGDHAALLLSELEGLSEFVLATNEPGTLFGLDAWALEYAFRDSDSEQSLFQIHMSVLCPLDAHVSDIVTLVVSHGGDTLGAEIEALRGIATSLRVARESSS